MSAETSTIALVVVSSRWACFMFSSGVQRANVTGAVWLLCGCCCVVTAVWLMLGCRVVAV